LPVLPLSLRAALWHGCLRPPSGVRGLPLFRGGDQHLRPPCRGAGWWPCHTGFHLFQAVADIEDRTALGREALQHHEKLVCLLRRQTEVGSSMINSCGSCRRQRMISMRWRSPTDRSPTIAVGKSAARKMPRLERCAPKVQPGHRDRAWRGQCSRQPSASQTARSAGTPCRCPGDAPLMGLPA
jgi:hypothetical protein